MIKKISKQKGFTLVEMIVSLGIFTVVAVIALGALLKVMDVSQKSITLKNAVDNMNFALDSMSREMRVGQNLYCVQSAFATIQPPLSAPSDNCSASFTSDWTLAFNSTKVCTNDPTNNVIYAYSFKKGVGNGKGTLSKAQQLPDCSNTITENDYHSVLADDIDIDNSLVNITVTGQPKTLFYFKGHVGVKTKDQTSFTVQTTVSQRVK